MIEQMFLSPDNEAMARAWIMAEEGSHKGPDGLHFPFVCGKDRLDQEQFTIAYGRLLPPGKEKIYLNGVTEKKAQAWLTQDINVAIGDVKARAVNWEALAAEARIAQMAMAYQLGATRYGGFLEMHKAIDAGDWEKAAIEMLDSAWASEKQTPARAWRTRNLFLLLAWHKTMMEGRLVPAPQPIV